MPFLEARCGAGAFSRLSRLKPHWPCRPTNPVQRIDHRVVPLRPVSSATSAFIFFNGVLLSAPSSRNP